MRLLMAAPVMLLATAAVAASPLALAPAADGGIDIRDGKAVAAHVALKTAAAAPRPAPAARAGRRRPPDRRAARPDPGNPCRGGLDRRAGAEGEVDLVGHHRAARRRRRDVDRRRAGRRARAGVPDRGGRHPLRRRPGAAVSPRLRLRQRQVPAGDVAVARAGHREADGPPRRSRDAGRAAGGRLPLDRERRARAPRAATRARWARPSS